MYEIIDQNRVFEIIAKMFNLTWFLRPIFQKRFKLDDSLEYLYFAHVTANILFDM